MKTLFFFYLRLVKKATILWSARHVEHRSRPCNRALIVCEGIRLDCRMPLQYSP
jgi:hypothetical protein